MNTETPKIIFRKNADGTTTKVLVQRVKKNIRLKPSSTQKSGANAGKNTSLKSKSPSKNYSSPSRGSSGDKNSSNNNRSFTKDKKSSFDSEHSHSQSRRTSNPSGSGHNDPNKKNKILITKKKNERGTKTGQQFYQKNEKKSFVEDKKNRQQDRNFSKLGEDYRKKEKKVVDEFAGVPKQIEIDYVISIKDFAAKLNLKTSQIIKKLFSLGVVNLTVNDSIDSEAAQIVCAEFQCEAKVVSLIDQTKIELEKGNEEDYVNRPPVVTIMGHVDHGKTTLLDYIRKTKVAEKESGGITQHLGAYKIKTDKGEITFIDTPGHSAFTAMRSRGAKITDIIVLVVSAVDGIMPQTIEAINHAVAAKCPIVVAINKIDLPTADVEKTKTLLSQHGVVLEEWGGETPVYPISALTGEGVKDGLLQGIVSLAEKKELKGNKKIKAYGYVLESKVDIGKGITASIIIKNGLLKQGDSYICGKNIGRVRAMFDEYNNKLKVAEPSAVVEIIGLGEPISSGELFQVTGDEKESRRIAEKRIKLEKQSEAAKVKHVTLSNLFATIKEKNIKELKLIIKSDTFGSGEAIDTCLKTLKNDEIKAHVIHNSIGAVNENDVNLAFTSQSEIIAFKVNATGKIKKLAEEKGVKIKYYDVIYNIVEDIKEDLTEKLGEEVNEIQKAMLEVKNVFKISNIGKIAGCEVLEGKIEKNHSVRIVRDGRIIYTGEISALKRFKDDAKEIETGKECGVSIKNFQDFKVGDRLEAIVIQKTKKVLKIKENL